MLRRGYRDACEKSNATKKTHSLCKLAVIERVDIKIAFDAGCAMPAFFAER